MRRRIAYGLLALGLGLGFAACNAAPADASPTCEPRSAEHAAQHHMTREADSRFHVEHGERPTCGLDKDSDHKDSGDNDDDRDIPHRDHEGYHCYHLHCG